MLNSLPIIGWLISFVTTTSLSLAFWVCWSVGGIGKTYFYFLPDTYQDIPFWNCVGLFIVISIRKGALTPEVFKISNNQENK